MLALELARGPHFVVLNVRRTDLIIGFFARRIKYSVLIGKATALDPHLNGSATAPYGVGVNIAGIDFNQMDQIRSRIPCLEHRRNPDQLSSTRMT